MTTTTTETSQNTTETTHPIAVGDHVRSFDFDGDDACYYEGVIVGIVKRSTEIAHNAWTFTVPEGYPNAGQELRPAFYDCDHYAIRVTRRVFGGEPVASRAVYVFPPVNGTPKLFGGYTDGVKPVNPLEQLTNEALDGEITGETELCTVNGYETTRRLDALFAERERRCRASWARITADAEPQVEAPTQPASPVECAGCPFLFCGSVACLKALDDGTCPRGDDDDDEATDDDEQPAEQGTADFHAELTRKDAQAFHQALEAAADQRADDSDDVDAWLDKLAAPATQDDHERWQAEYVAPVVVTACLGSGLYQVSMDGQDVGLLTQGTDRRWSFSGEARTSWPALISAPTMREAVIKIKAAAVIVREIRRLRQVEADVCEEASLSYSDPCADVRLTDEGDHLFLTFDGQGYDWWSAEADYHASDRTRCHLAAGLKPLGLYFEDHATWALSVWF